tara:strand:+ start:2347 stop:3021 length:675 start_codon:yes stop_codon:yes gene_type:complete
MSLNLNYDFPPMTFDAVRVDDIDLPEYNHVSKYGKDKEIEAILIDKIYYKKDKYGEDKEDKYGRKIAESYGYIIYKQAFNINYDPSKYDEVPGILVYVKLDEDIKHEDVKRVLKSSIIQNGAKQYAKKYIEKLQKPFYEPTDADLDYAQRITKLNSNFNQRLTDPHRTQGLLPNPMPDHKRVYFGGKSHKKLKTHKLKRRKSRRHKSNRRKYKKRKTRRHNKSK